MELSLRKISEKAWFRIGFFALSLIAMIAFGILGGGRSGTFADSNFDLKFLYVGGLAWQQGLNAYDPNVINRLGSGFVEDIGGFFYPPQIAPLCFFLSSFSWPKAQILMTGINLFSVGTIAFFCVRMVHRPLSFWPRQADTTAIWIIPSIIMLCPFVAHVLWMGQTSLIATAALIGSWYHVQRGRWAIGGFLLAIATIKPQICLLAILWLLLERQWKVLAFGFAMAMVFCAAPMVIEGPVNIFVEWLESLKIHQTIPYNQLGHRHIFGLQNLFYSIGIKLPKLMPISIASVGLLWWKRNRLVPDDILALLLSSTFLFGFAAHDYDLVALAALIPAFWLHLRQEQGQEKHHFFAAGLVVLLFTPQRLLRPLEIEVLMQFRVPVLLCLTLWLAVMSWQQTAIQPQAIGANKISSLSK